jgi:DNA (cytosine-5)-methyltransferase 1
MSKPVVLDLFCCQGGAGYGYSRAGWRVHGVDILPQPRYPFWFEQADALEYLRQGNARHFDLIHASPPCQAFTVYGNNAGHVRDDHPNLIPEVRDLLERSGKPYVIENVPKAPLKGWIQLCGTSFGVEVRRHRWFESSLPLEALPCAHGRFTERKYPGSSNRPNGRTVCNLGEYRVPLNVQRAVTGYHWMDLYGISQSHPWQFTQWIGMQALEQRSRQLAVA